MSTKEVKLNAIFFYWLTISLILVFSLIILGGLTRLTNSGLSIIEWELFKGILPPLNEDSWQIYFDKYKTIPQYKLLNFDMSIQEFKIIFYWEYFHRILARIIGLIFIIPLIFFYFSNRIKKNYLNICFLIFFLILVQGIVGWFMVKSGLVHNVTVSHYRLSLHLSIAVIIISMMFWLLINIHSGKDKTFFTLSKAYFPYQFLLLIIFLQIILGAFVSGLDAGMIYQTWPMMGNSFFPNDIIVNKFNKFFEFNNHSLVQFYHRTLGYFIVLYVSFLAMVIYFKKVKKLYKPLLILLFFILLQIILVIFTLITGLNIYFASAHQIFGVFLVFSAVNLYYFNAK